MRDASERKLEQLLELKDYGNYRFLLNHQRLGASQSMKFFEVCAAEILRHHAGPGPTGEGAILQPGRRGGLAT